MQDPKELVTQKIWDGAICVPMRNQNPESPEAVTQRLTLLRRAVARENQTAFAARLGIEVRRWNNFERGSPLSKEVAFLIVRKFPNVTLDWLWLGKTDGLPVLFQRELEEAGKATTSAPAKGRSRA